jgi:hypothetical protein
MLAGHRQLTGSSSSCVASSERSLAGGGLYWLIPAAIASLLGGVVNAWLFALRMA